MTYSIASKTTTGSKKEESEPNGDWLRWLDQMTEDDRSVENILKKLNNTARFVAT